MLSGNMVNNVSAAAGSGRGFWDKYGRRADLSLIIVASGCEPANEGSKGWSVWWVPPSFLIRDGP